MPERPAVPAPSAQVYEPHAEQQIREQAAYDKGYADGLRDSKANDRNACPWCAVSPRARHHDWCPCSTASRREIRAAYKVSDFEGMRAADKIRAFAQREALTRVEQEREGYKRDFLAASERVELCEERLALARREARDE